MVWNWNGINMEWKEKISTEYGMAQLWNGMEDLMYGMEQLFHLSVFHTSFILAHFDMVLLKFVFSFS